MSGNRSEQALGRLRRKIDRFDGRIMRLLLKRSRAVETVGTVKKMVGLPVIDRKRESQILSRIDTLRGDARRKVLLRRVYECIFRFSCELEKGKRTGDGSGN